MESRPAGTAADRPGVDAVKGTATAANRWAAEQLAEFLDALAAAPDEAAVTAVAAQRASELLSAEVGACFGDSGPIATVGLPVNELIAAELCETALVPSATVTVPSLGEITTLAVPVADERVTRLLVGRRGEQGFNAEEAGLIRTMARILALAIQLRRGLESERELKEQSERRGAENQILLTSLRERQRLLERLARIQRKIVTRSALKDVLEAIVWGARELLGDETVGLRLLDPGDSGRMILVASTGVPPELLDDSRHGRVGDGAGGLAIAEERLVAIDDYQASGDANSMFVQDGVRAAMAAPVEEHGKVAGSLVVATHVAGRSYSQAEREVLLAFAEHASLALTDARVVEQATNNAFYDSLTGLPNRVLLLDRLAQALARASRADKRVAVLFCDLDGFKTVNDSLGHAAGDELLAAVARRIEASIRSGDTAARFGGDEFAVLLEDVSDEEVATASRRILGGMADPFTLGGREVFVSASIGVAFGTDESEDLLRNADLALYRAKARGKGRFEVFKPEMHAAVVARMELETDLQRALRRDELELDYQPIYDLSSGRLTAMEALVRWRHPTRGRLGPAEFIPLAESGRLIHELGRSVLRAACRQCAEIRSHSAASAELQVTVNISGEQLKQAALVDEVATALDDSGLRPDALILELTETAFMDDIESVTTRLEALRNLGVSLAVDDFGTGYSSLQHLSRFPIDYLKIARPFVVGIGEDDDAAIARAIVYLAESFGLRVIAEGIENEAQVARLIELGATMGQGFHLGRPMPGAALLELFASGPSGSLAPA
ncbi:hypothetical protein BH24ACT23_BH24ACT23_11830 [soil metagenome]